MGYRLKLPSGQEITAPLAGTGASQTQQQTMDKVQGVWERCKEKFSNRVAVLEQATTNLLKTLLPMNCGFMLRKRPQTRVH